MGALYGGIDLHSNNSVVLVKEATGRVLYRKRLKNDLAMIEQSLNVFRDRLETVVVESTFNWYWLVDGLKEAGYCVQLANPSACRQYSGLKHTDDESDADWLAEMARLKILPTGYIYPKADRGIRDLLRKRGQLVRQRSAQILSVQNILRRSEAKTLKGDRIKALTNEEIEAVVSDPDVRLAVEVSVEVIRCLEQQIVRVEKRVLEQVKLREEFAVLKSIPGVGNILALTIMLEVGTISRFPSVGKFASYCRCVSSNKLSNFKKKGEGNRKNGNRYLAWAFIEAANFAIRYNVPIQRFHQRKKTRTKAVVAKKAVAHKLARAAFHMLRNNQKFEVSKAFS